MYSMVLKYTFILQAMPIRGGGGYLTKPLTPWSKILAKVPAITTVFDIMFSYHHWVCIG